MVFHPFTIISVLDTCLEILFYHHAAISSIPIQLIYAKLLLFLFHSSFNDKPVNEDFVGPIGRELFEKEQDDLLMDLINIPKKACDRRVCHPFIFYLLTVCFIGFIGYIHVNYTDPSLHNVDQ